MASTTRYTKAKNEALRTYAQSGGDSTFQAVGSAFTEPVRMLKFKNDGNTDCYISYDGTTTHDIILAGDREIEDLTTNKTIDEGLTRKEGTQIYAKSVSGTGNLYITTIYASKT